MGQILASRKPVVTQPTWLDIGHNLKTALFHKTAKMAGYAAAYPTPSTTIGSRIATNANSTWGTLQRTSLMFTGEMVVKNSAIAPAYLKVRANYCRPQLYKPDTGDDGLDIAVTEYCLSKWKTMGMDCSMQDAAQRTLHWELPIRGDAGMVWYEDENGDKRLMEFCADQLGEIYYYIPPRECSLGRDKNGNLMEIPGRDVWYFAGRYFSGMDCVAYKIYQRTNSFYGSPKIYPAYDVIYAKDPLNFKGLRGITVFASVLQNMQRAEDMLAAGLSAAQRQARTFGRVYNQNGQPDEGTYETDGFSAGRMTFFQHTPGHPTEEFYYNGDQAEWTSPDSPGAELLGGVDASDERTCIGLGFTYAFVMSGKNLGGAPSRLDTNRSGKEIERLESDICDPCFNRISEVTILQGVRNGDLPPAENITRGKWIYTNLPTADAFKDSMDDVKSVRAGQDSDTRVTARYGTTPEEIMRDKKKETILAYRTLNEVNTELARLGVKERATIADIRQVSDNPLQSQQADNLVEGKTTTGVNPVASAKLSAFVGDVSISSLPENVQLDIRRMIPQVSSDSLVSRYGMTVPELVNKADQHNLESARKNIKRTPNYEASNYVHVNGDKHILVMNDRIVDGHHFLAKAEKGKVSKSLPVIDLTPTRFQ